MVRPDTIRKRRTLFGLVLVFSVVVLVLGCSDNKSLIVPTDEEARKRAEPQVGSYYANRDGSIREGGGPGNAVAQGRPGGGGQESAPRVAFGGGTPVGGGGMATMPTKGQ